MTPKKFGQMIAMALTLTVACTGTYAEETVYKWVDEDGVVHFSDAPPAEGDPTDTETIVIPKSAPVAAPAQPAAKPATVPRTSSSGQSKKPAAETSPLFEKIDITNMSLADLDRRCEDAREKMIVPLREAEIAKCQQDKKNDPAWCERFNADYGDGGRTVSGSIRPRMFDDLPECVEAMQEKNRRR
jgi:hypothetical protein